MLCFIFLNLSSLKHQDETASLINRAANQEVEEMMENSRTKDQKKYYEIDKSKYDTYPLQKIIGIQKIKSFAVSKFIQF